MANAWIDFAPLTQGMIAGDTAKYRQDSLDFTRQQEEERNRQWKIGNEQNQAQFEETNRQWEIGNEQNKAQLAINQAIEARNEQTAVDNDIKQAQAFVDGEILKQLNANRARYANSPDPTAAAFNDLYSTNNNFAKLFDEVTQKTSVSDNDLQNFNSPGQSAYADYTRLSGLSTGLGNDSLSKRYAQGAVNSEILTGDGGFKQTNLGVNTPSPTGGLAAMQKKLDTKAAERSPYKTEVTQEVTQEVPVVDSQAEYNQNNPGYMLGKNIRDGVGNTINNLGNATRDIYDLQSDALNAGLAAANPFNKIDKNGNVISEPGFFAGLFNTDAETEINGRTQAEWNVLNRERTERHNPTKTGKTVPTVTITPNEVEQASTNTDTPRGSISAQTVYVNGTPQQAASVAAQRMKKYEQSVTNLQSAFSNKKKGRKERDLIGTLFLATNPTVLNDKELRTGVATYIKSGVGSADILMAEKTITGAKALLDSQLAVDTNETNRYVASTNADTARTKADTARIKAQTEANKLIMDKLKWETEQGNAALENLQGNGVFTNVVTEVFDADNGMFMFGGNNRLPEGTTANSLLLNMQSQAVSMAESLYGIATKPNVTAVATTMANELKATTEYDDGWFEFSSNYNVDPTVLMRVPGVTGVNYPNSTAEQKMLVNKTAKTELARSGDANQAVAYGAAVELYGIREKNIQASFKNLEKAGIPTRLYPAVVKYWAAREDKNNPIPISTAKQIADGLAQKNAQQLISQ